MGSLLLFCLSRLDHKRLTFFTLRIILKEPLQMFILSTFEDPDKLLRVNTACPLHLPSWKAAPHRPLLAVLFLRLIDSRSGSQLTQFIHGTLLSFSSLCATPNWTT